MDPLDELFSKDGWIVTAKVDGKTKVTSCNCDETNLFNKTRNGWITFHESEQLTEDQEKDENTKRRFKSPFQNVGTNNNQKRVGFYLIRDLLNFKRPNDLTEAFVADNITLTKVMVCARITSYEQKNDFYRLILDDGTSSILCMVKIKDETAHLQDSDEELETSHYGTEETEKNSDVLWAIKKLTLQRDKIINDSSINFSPTSLGRPVRIMGYLREFCGKNFIYSYNFRWVSEKYFVNYLSSIIESYEYKENYMYE